MTTIKCHTFLGSQEPKYGLPCRPKMVADDGRVYVWRHGRWQKMSVNEDIEAWIKASDKDRLIIRGKLRIKV